MGDQEAEGDGDEDEVVWKFTQLSRLFPSSPEAHETPAVYEG